MKTWETVENEIITGVFAEYGKELVSGSDDFEKDGLLDSLTIVAILAVLDEANPDADYLEFATAEDFRSLGAIHALYEKALAAA